MNELTDEQINVAVAEWCGWTFPNPDQGKEMNLGQKGPPPNLTPVMTMWGTPPKRWGWAATNLTVPAYATSLDAVALAEARLNREQRAAYAETLTYAIRDQETPGFYHERFVLLTLPARQRCLALLRVVRPSA